MILKRTEKPDEVLKGEAEPVEQVSKPMRELEEIHTLFDALGVPEGFAADRLARWFERKVTGNRANGHQASCQCQMCSEDRIVQRVLQDLREPKGGV